MSLGRVGAEARRSREGLLSGPRCARTAAMGRRRRRLVFRACAPPATIASCPDSWRSWLRRRESRIDADGLAAAGRVSQGRGAGEGDRDRGPTQTDLRGGRAIWQVGESKLSRTPRPRACAKRNIPTRWSLSRDAIERDTPPLLTKRQDRDLVLREHAREKRGG